jgi:hypothetical protein
MQLPTTIEATWLGVIAALIGIGSALAARYWGRASRRGKAIHKAARDYRHAVASGDEEGMVLAARRYRYLKNGGALLLLLSTLLLAGCRTPAPVTLPPVLSEHCNFVEPGYVVPPLPTGQTRWLLLTYPTGISLALPVDFPTIDPDPDPNP